MNLDRPTPVPQSSVLGVSVALGSQAAATRLCPSLAAVPRFRVSPNEPPEWRGVFFDGPEPGLNSEGEEIPVWIVYIGNEDAEPLGTVYRCHSFSGAEGLARRISQDRRLELVQEATTA